MLVQNSFQTDLNVTVKAIHVYLLQTWNCPFVMRRAVFCRGSSLFELSALSKDNGSNKVNESILFLFYYLIYFIFSQSNLSLAKFGIHHL